MLVHVGQLLDIAGDWKSFLCEPDEEDAAKIRQHERTGRALGEESFLDNLEMTLMRQVKRLKPGRKMMSVNEK